MQLIECVPNFSEGNNQSIIDAIADAIRLVHGVRLLNIDAGKAANRTVYTFVGEPEPVIEAAFLAIKKASELIDMSVQRGEHPRMGATDVCPLIPISNITVAETAKYAKQLGARVGSELDIPVYLYEDSQPDKTRSNLSVIRSGEYEGFFNKINLPGWQPDFGPTIMNARAGATVIGARGFLVAYNVNLDTQSTKVANEIAADVRETGQKGKPGKLKSVKAIGWYIEEYGIAQVSMNLVNLLVTPLHIAFEEVCKSASVNGANVTGSELIGLVPLKCLVDAGKYFLHKQQKKVDVAENEIVAEAVKILGLAELAPFNPRERVIEYLLNKP